MKVTSKTAECYQVTSNNGYWLASIFLTFGKGSVIVAISSDYGNFAYNWLSCGDNPKAFLASLRFDYAMSKLNGRRPVIPDPDRYQDEVKERIFEALEEKILTQAEAEQALKEMASIEPEPGIIDAYFWQLREHPLFDKVFGDCENLPGAKKQDPLLREFWDFVWVPFCDQLKAELKNEAA